MEAFRRAVVPYVEYILSDAEIFQTSKSYAEDRAESNAAKAPMEGAITRCQVIYVGGFPRKPKKKSDSLSLGFYVMEDSFIFKPENLARKEWFGEENKDRNADRVQYFL